MDTAAGPDRFDRRPLPADMAPGGQDKLLEGMPRGADVPPDRHREARVPQEADTVPADNPLPVLGDGLGDIALGDIGLGDNARGLGPDNELLLRVCARACVHVSLPSAASSAASCTPSWHRHQNKSCCCCCYCLILIVILTRAYAYDASHDETWLLLFVVLQ